MLSERSKLVGWFAASALAIVGLGLGVTNYIRDSLRVLPPDEQVFQQFRAIVIPAGDVWVEAPHLIRKPGLTILASDLRSDRTIASLTSHYKRELERLGYRVVSSPVNHWGASTLMFESAGFLVVTEFRKGDDATILYYLGVETRAQ